MRQEITITEMSTFESKAMKYIAWMLGLNLRPGEAIFDEASGTYKVPINAIVRNKVFGRSGEPKVFVFPYPGVGELWYDKESNLKKASTAEEIDNELVRRFWTMHSAVEKEILEAGRPRWGKLTWIRAFLRPMYTIVIRILTKGSEKAQTFRDLEMWEYAKLLMEDEYLKYSPQDPDLLIADNQLTMLHQITYAEGEKAPSDKAVRGKVDSEKVEHGITDLFEVADAVIGDVFSRRYPQLIQEFGLHSASAYVDLTKTYYVDAIDIGEPIAIAQDELFKNYARYVNRPVREDREISFGTLVSELIAAKLLSKERDKITGDPSLFHHLMKFRDEMLKGVEIL